MSIVEKKSKNTANISGDTWVIRLKTVVPYADDCNLEIKANDLLGTKQLHSQESEDEYKQKKKKNQTED